MFSTTFFVKTMVILGIQLVDVFCLVTTLCESGGTLDVVVRSKVAFVHPIVPHLVFEANVPQRCLRFKLNLSMWMWPNFMTFKHGQPLSKSMLFLVWWFCIVREGIFFVKKGINSLISTW
jgi:hypothetical protein